METNNTVLARQIIRYSLQLQPKEHILIECTDEADELCVALLQEIYAVGGIPLITRESISTKRALLMGMSEEQAQLWYECELFKMERMDAYIAIRTGSNPYALSDVPNNSLAIYNTYYGKLHLGQRCPHTRWCVLSYPSTAIAQQAQMSYEGFEEYYYRVCNLDYADLSRRMAPLKTLMDTTSEVEISAEGTNLAFSIEKMNSTICDGKANLPDGEVYMPVVQDSVEGTIAYNIPSSYQGRVFSHITLHFEKGKVVDATCDQSDELHRILDTDEGARYVGEFALGVHPHIDRPIINTLFDEKMRGSLHIALGYGGEKPSAIHWDMIQSHLAHYGGGSVTFDGTVIRKDGLFLLDELKPLNYNTV